MRASPDFNSDKSDETRPAQAGTKFFSRPIIKFFMSSFWYGLDQWGGAGLIFLSHSAIDLALIDFNGYLKYSSEHNRGNRHNPGIMIFAKISTGMDFIGGAKSINHLCLSPTSIKDSTSLYIAEFGSCFAHRRTKLGDASFDKSSPHLFPLFQTNKLVQRCIHCTFLVWINILS